ncbi:MAG: transposase, partial [Chloroflexi bacterium]|nr:transposase [Chloroflexota bacterium]
GWVKGTFHRPLAGTAKNCTVSKTKSGKYFVSIQCEVDIPDPEPRDEGRVGLDLGLIDFVTTSTGEKVPAPKYLRRAERRLQIRQRRLSRKQRGSHTQWAAPNREKARHLLAIQHEKVANQRLDFHHQLSRDLVDRYAVIAIEDLHIQGLVQNHCLAKSITDAGWGQFVRFLTYKATWSGGIVLNADRFFPSSKLCSECGRKNQELALSDRQWVCLECGTVHDRDVNAAVNILQTTTGGAPESHTQCPVDACGDMIPVRGSAQEAPGFSPG